MVFKSKAAERMFYIRAIANLVERGFRYHADAPEICCCCLLANDLAIILADKAYALTPFPTQNT